MLNLLFIQSSCVALIPNRSDMPCRITPHLACELFHYDQIVFINRMLGSTTSMIHSPSQKKHHLEIHVVHMKSN